MDETGYGIDGKELALGYQERGDGLAPGVGDRLCPEGAWKSSDLDGPEQALWTPREWRPSSRERYSASSLAAGRTH